MVHILDFGKILKLTVNNVMNILTSLPIIQEQVDQQKLAILKKSARN